MRFKHSQVVFVDCLSTLQKTDSKYQIAVDSYLNRVFTEKLSSNLFDSDLNIRFFNLGLGYFNEIGKFNFNLDHVLFEKYILLLANRIKSINDSFLILDSKLVLVFSRYCIKTFLSPESIRAIFKIKCKCIKNTPKQSTSEASPILIESFKSIIDYCQHDQYAILLETVSSSISNAYSETEHQIVVLIGFASILIETRNENGIFNFNLVDWKSVRKSIILLLSETDIIDFTKAENNSLFCLQIAGSKFSMDGFEHSRNRCLRLQHRFHRFSS